MKDPTARIFELENEVSLLKREIETLKQLLFRKDRQDPNFPITWDTKNCRKCGISLEGVMSYSCPRKDCPTGLGPVWCGVTE